MSKAVAALALGFALYGCMAKYEITDLNPKAASPSTGVENRISGKYAVAIVGDLTEPLVIRTVVKNRSNQVVGPGYEQISILLGEPLKKAISAALAGSGADLQFVEREDEANALVTQGKGAIIVRYTGARVEGDKQRTFLGMTTTATITLDGQITLIPQDAAKATRPILARGTSTQTSYSPLAVDENVPAPKAAAEMAIAEFAAQAVSEAAAVLSK
jgi:hypothetical protein